MVRISFNIILSLIVAILYCANTWAQTANAYLERNPIHADETVRLVLEVDTDVNEEIDLNGLKRDFVIHGTSTSKNVNIVNGKKTTRTRWWVEMEANAEGVFTIPSLSLGSARTQPLQLTVLPAGTQPNNAPRDVTLQAFIEPDETYVQAQLTYTIRLELAVNVTNGRLSEPEIPSAIVQRLGEDASYEANRNGRRLRVIERQYTIFPQESGELVIPAMQFAGRASENFSNGRLLDDFFGSSRVVRAKSEEVRVKVKPKPASFAGRIWLPASDLRINESWTQDPPQFRVGEPITRTLRIEALGLSGEQLPQMPQENVDGVRSYPDQSETNTGRDGTRVVGVREERVALVPGRAGQLTLPEISLPWWDVEDNTERVAVVPARIIEVLPAKSVVVTAPENPVADNKLTHQSTTDVVAATKDMPAGWWPIISAVFALLWLSTLFYIWRSRRAPASDVNQKNAPVELRVAKNAIKTACFNNDARATKNALLSWAMIRWPQQETRGLTGIGARFGQEALTRELENLNRVLYSPGVRDDWSGEALWRVFVDAEKAPVTIKSVNNVLPPLYPETA